GSGMDRATPMTGTSRTLASPESGVSRSHEPDPLPHVAQRRLGHLGGRLAALLDDVAELLLVLEELEGAVAERRHEVDDHVGEVLLEVAVTAPGVLLLEVADAPRRERGVDRQQV